MEIAPNQNTDLAVSNVPLGFENEEAGDLIIPRIKVTQALSPEVRDKKIGEGVVVNSLTLEDLTNKTFIPVFKFSSNIDWRARSEGGGIICRSLDGKVATDSTGACLTCAACKKNEFDNTKTGRDAIPVCTKYINFFGFIAGTSFPLVLSFSKTNYAEGKKLFSLAKVTMQNMWNFGYKLVPKVMKKNNNEWFNLEMQPVGATDVADRTFGLSLFKQFSGNVANINIAEVDDSSYSEDTPPVDTTKTEY